MNTEFIVSLLADDRKGLIQFLEHNSHQHQGQWLSSKFTQLGGQVTALIHLSVPQQNEQALKAFFDEQEEMLVRFAAFKAADKPSAKPLKLNIEAKDRLGLINKISQRLESLGLTIKHMECHRISVIEIGGNLLSIDISLSPSEVISEKQITSALDDLSDHIVVRINK